jgi:methionine-rich copper-binding protein CopC
MRETNMHYIRKEMIVAIALSLIPTAALAHALLQKADPPVGGAVNTSPTEIRIDFSEGVEPAFSGIILTTGDNRVVPVGKTGVDPENPAVMIVKIGSKLAPGTYKVDWHAVAVDTHRTEGSFTFTVQ